MIKHALEHANKLKEHIKYEKNFSQHAFVHT